MPAMQTKKIINSKSFVLIKSFLSLAIAIEGEPDLSTLAISTPTATEAFNNVAMATDVWLPCGCCQAISVKNTSTQTISVANANITVNRVG